MTRVLMTMAVFGLLGACGSPMRGYDWYKAHPAEAAKVAAACGPSRREDCANAAKALADAASDRRLNTYRKSF